MHSADAANEDMKAKAARQIESLGQNKTDSSLRSKQKQPCVHAQVVNKDVAVRKTLDLFWPKRQYERY